MNAPMTLDEWNALGRNARRAAWQTWTNEQRTAMFGLLAAETPNYALPYPEDYNDPADSPTAFRELAIATDSALALMMQTVTAEASYVKGPTAEVITDWNAATESGFYKSWPGALNPPATSLGDTPWLGLALKFDTNWTVQLAWPYGPYPRGAMSMRWSSSAGVWSAWRRDANYAYSWGTLSGLRWMKHGGTEVSRFADGFSKDDTTELPTALDEWRVQCYDPAGAFTWSAIKIPESGIVSMPRGHSVVSQRIRDGEPVQEDSAATVGTVIEIVRAMLAGAEPETSPAGDDREAK